MITREIASIILLACALFWVGKEAIKKPTVTISHQHNGVTVSCQIKAAEADKIKSCFEEKKNDLL